MGSKRHAVQKRVTYEDDSKDYKLKEQNKILRDKVRRLESDIRKLKSELKTFEGAWKKTERYLENVTGDRSLEELIENVNLQDPLYKKEEMREKRKEKKLQELKDKGMICPKCGNEMGLLKMGKFTVEICKCGHKRKIDEGTSKTQNESGDGSNSESA